MRFDCIVRSGSCDGREIGDAHIAERHQRATTRRARGDEFEAREHVCGPCWVIGRVLAAGNKACCRHRRGGSTRLCVTHERLAPPFKAARNDHLFSRRSLTRQRDHAADLSQEVSTMPRMSVRV